MNAGHYVGQVSAILQTLQISFQYYISVNRGFSRPEHPEPTLKLNISDQVQV